MSDEAVDDGRDPPGLTPKQAMFCREYMIDLNAAQAAIRAGYSEDSARVIGPENLSKPAVAADIARRKRDRAARLGIDADRVLAQLGRLAFSDIRGIETDDGRLLRVADLDDDTAAAVQSVKVARRQLGEGEYDEVVEYRLADKRGPLQDLAKHLGELVERHEVGVSDDALEVLGWLNEKYGPRER